MTTNESKENVADRSGRPDPTAVSVSGTDVRGTVFVIPLDSPLPSELADVKVPTGSLFDRLAPLNNEPIDSFSIIPISGNELLALEKAWRLLQRVKNVVVLSELPGARYDVIFDTARKAIGIRTLDWPAVADAIASKVRTVQRTNDKAPWLINRDLADADGSSPAERGFSPLPARGSNVGRHESPPMPTPSEDDGDAD